MATTTPAAIRDRAITVIEALTPSSDVTTRFRKSQNMSEADFQAQCETNPTGCERRFQVRCDGSTEAPPVSDTLVEEHRCTLSVLVAYPQTQRWGRDAALDRDDVIDEDRFQIDKAVGMLGKANFTSPYADATWVEGAPPDRIVGAAVDFLELRYAYIYKRAR